MESPLISIKQYLGKDKPFVIPYFQRGYIWGKSRGSEKDSVRYLMESIRNCYSNQTELFLQGVTVSESELDIWLIDGQQRTLTIYMLLHFLGYKGPFSIQYPVRDQAERFLRSLQGISPEEMVAMCKEDDNEPYQDIYYFKKCIRVMAEELKDIDKPSLIEFLVENERIKFLYIDIPKDKAVAVFTMMNGNKALMRTEEIIKAEMLRLVSDRKIIEDCLNEKGKEALRWDQNLVRSKYAREWDKWLYWWNKPDVKQFYHTSEVMGLLVETFFYSKNPNSKFNFENFRDNMLRSDVRNYTLLAKEVFYELRQLQKLFEDVFNSYNEPNSAKRLHNKIGVILILLNPEDRKKFIRSYFPRQNEMNIDEWLKIVYLGLTFTQVEKAVKRRETGDDGYEIFQEVSGELLNSLQNDNLYNEDCHHAFNQLLRLNVEEDTRLERRFDFSIWEERSLEHIYPKSKVFHREDGVLKNGSNEPITNPDESYLDRAKFNGDGSEHCIGNLVLLYKNENSSFGAGDFNEKKSKYFTLAREKTFRSRHLLHTISVFAKEKWDVTEIRENKHTFIKEVKEYYGIQ